MNTYRRSMTKRPYTTPVLEDLGELRDVTEGSPTPGPSDGAGYTTVPAS